MTAPSKNLTHNSRQAHGAYHRTPKLTTRTCRLSTKSCPELAEEPVLSMSKESDLFLIFAKKWFAFSLAARHNVGNNSPSQAQHNSTVKRYLTPISRFQNTPKTTYVKWSTITRTTLPQTLFRMDGERMRASMPALPYFHNRHPVIKLSRLPCYHRRHHHG